MHPSEVEVLGLAPCKYVHGKLDEIIIGSSLREGFNKQTLKVMEFSIKGFLFQRKYKDDPSC